MAPFQLLVPMKSISLILIVLFLINFTDLNPDSETWMDSLKIGFTIV